MSSSARSRARPIRLVARNSRKSSGKIVRMPIHMACPDARSSALPARRVEEALGQRPVDALRRDVHVAEIGIDEGQQQLATVALDAQQRAAAAFEHLGDGAELAGGTVDAAATLELEMVVAVRRRW